MGTLTPTMPPDHVELELPGRAAVAGEDGGAVAVLVVVDQPQRLVVGVRRARRDSTGPKISSCVAAAMSGVHVVDQGRAEEEAVARRPSASPAVDDDVGAVAAALVEVARHLVAVLAGDQRAHLGGGSVAGPDCASGRAGR